MADCLSFELRHLTRRNRDGSHATQAGRLQLLGQCAADLKLLGFRRMGAGSLKPKHVDALISKWQGEGLAAGTLKNRLSALRWWAEKIGKPSLLSKDNAAYGIEARQFVTKDSKAIDLTRQALAGIADDRIRIALRLQAAFGLRREEALKFRPMLADRGDHVALKGSWCKGGRARQVPILTPRQRALLEEAKAVAGRGSLIPDQLRYVDQLQRYKFLTSSAGISKTHGLRHWYAQWRYQQLTGWAAPASGGPSRRQLTPVQREIDRDARLRVSAELGHGREQVTAVYLGR
jgi:hypothetical protein